jgi:Protein of unknown function (DUF3093)
MAGGQTGADPRRPGDVKFRESIPAPWALWAVALGLVAFLAVAIEAALGPWAGSVVLVVAAVGVAMGLRGTTGRISIEAASLHAGRAALPLDAAGAAVALDAEAARWLRGPGADPRAYLYLRSWVPTAVRVDVTDPGDPAPYWYVSTRHPEALVAAIEAARP